MLSSSSIIRLIAAATASLFAATCAKGTPLIGSDPPVPLSKLEIANFKNYTFYAAAAYCKPKDIETWTCGGNCKHLPSFRPYKSRGDGNAVQYWFVGYDSYLQTVVVAHQGTDPFKFLSVLTDADVHKVPLPALEFPGMPDDILVHRGFLNAHDQSWYEVFHAVGAQMAEYKTDSVTIIGHSLGKYLRCTATELPPNPSLSMKVVTYGMPRVGNQAFADWVDEHIPDLRHINNLHDPVPIVPWTAWGFAHPSGEVHIQPKNVWVACPGQDNESRGCSRGDTPWLVNSRLTDHIWFYDGLIVGTCHQSPFATSAVVTAPPTIPNLLRLQLGRDD
ncbi:alpha/beta-hydrolase [Exidia glandulosa HHB12029]|uniref:Alpha/beta-hydrolase n=1 Tax=Exidia glandulosa HHB12029 TaxID=1314781 RepID=A0A165MX59_EXIGL|nr:alpha/beta-hydrolase [Exidia glandulosa HHB12029]